MLFLLDSRRRLHFVRKQREGPEPPLDPGCKYFFKSLTKLLRHTWILTFCLIKTGKQPDFGEFRAQQSAVPSD